MKKINLSTKCKKYIVLGRELVINNLNGDPIRKLISEVFVLVPNTSESGGIAEYRRLYYREIIGGRGTDLADMDAGTNFATFDKTIGDFFEMNFESYPELETNTIKAFKTYSNRSFVKRKRATSFHEEYDVEVNTTTGKTKAKKTK